jgi:hypothetical protein
MSRPFPTAFLAASHADIAGCEGPVIGSTGPEAAHIAFDGFRYIIPLGAAVNFRP